MSNVLMTSSGLYIAKGMRSSHAGPIPHYNTTANLNHATVFGARFSRNETIALKAFGELTAVPAYSTTVVTIGVELKEV